MNSSLLFPNIWRFIILVLVQSLVLKQVAGNVGEYFSLFLYPLIILLLPIQMAGPVVILIAFFTGLTVDIFYTTPGIHAAASVFSGYLRFFLLKIFEPRGGYTSKEFVIAPVYFGIPWFLQFAGIFYALHLFFYFSVDAFTFVYIGSIALKTVISWCLSMILVFFYALLFNPKQ